MRTLLIGIVGGLALGLAIPDDALAQGRRGRGSDDVQVVIRGAGGSVIMLGVDDVRRGIPRRSDRRADPRFRDHGGEGIPAFCRTGEGHPVFGIQWCFDRRMRDEGIPPSVGQGKDIRCSADAGAWSGGMGWVPSVAGSSEMPPVWLDLDDAG